jgi:hypothetical protein
MTTTSAVPGTASRHATPSTPASNGSPSTASLVAGLLMVTGLGWNAGLEAVPFHPVTVGITALAIHTLPLAAVMTVVVRAWRSASRGRGVTIAAVLALAFGAFSAIFSVTHPHAQMGVHDVNDVLPIAVLVAGALLWLARGRKASRTGRPSA